MLNIQRRVRRCTRCRHEWVIRELGRDPKTCPHCRSPYWNRKRTKAPTVQAISKGAA